jgi:hypothetical protein
MSSVKSPDKNTAQALDQKAIQGVTKYFAKVKNMTIAGTVYTPVALKAVFQAEIDAITALDTSEAQFKQQAADTRTARAKAIVVRAGLRAYILATYGAAAVQVLGDFGMVVPKPLGKRSAQVKADAVTKAQATREARKAREEQPSTAGAPSPAAPAPAPAQVAQATSPVQVAAQAARATLPN